MGTYIISRSKRRNLNNCYFIDLTDVCIEAFSVDQVHDSTMLKTSGYIRDLGGK